MGYLSVGFLAATGFGTQYRQFQLSLASLPSAIDLEIQRYLRRQSSSSDRRDHRKLAHHPGGVSISRSSGDWAGPLA